MDRREQRWDRLVDDVAMLKGAVTREVALQQADVIAEDMGLTLVRIVTGRPPPIDSLATCCGHSRLLPAQFPPG